MPLGDYCCGGKSAPSKAMSWVFATTISLGCIVAWRRITDSRRSKPTSATHGTYYGHFSSSSFLYAGDVPNHSAAVSVVVAEPGFAAPAAEDTRPYPTAQIYISPHHLKYTIRIVVWQPANKVEQRASHENAFGISRARGSNPPLLLARRKATSGTGRRQIL